MSFQRSDTQQFIDDSVALLGTVVSSANFVAQFTPIPALAPALMVVGEIINVCQKITSNRSEVLQLEERCKQLITALNDPAYQTPRESSIDRIAARCSEHLNEVLMVISRHADLPKWQQVVNQRRISDDIVRCHQRLDACCTEFQMRFNMQFHQWQNENEMARIKDQSEIKNALQRLGEQQSELIQIMKEFRVKQDLLTQKRDPATELMQLVQDLLSKETQNNSTGDDIDSPDYHSLANTLYVLQKCSGRLPPAIALEAKEARRIGDYAVKGNAAFDIWEGLWLNREKVVMKTIRSVKVSKNTKIRFSREAEIWKKIWEVDQGRYIVPFYGIGYDNGPNPYIVSPWMNNGNVNEYIKSNPDADKREIIKGIAEGLRLLHNFKPNAITHGDIRGINILINDAGQPMLTDFGLSKILEGVTGVPFTQTTGISESFRWFAPEMCQSPGIISTSTDVFSFAMTIIEIFTERPPYDHIRTSIDALIQMQAGKRPNRPTDPASVERGFDDDIWRIAQTCWAHAMADRPTIDWVLEQF